MVEMRNTVSDNAPFPPSHVKRPHLTKPRQELTLNSPFLRLGTWVASHPKRVLLAWLIVIVVVPWGAHKLPHPPMGATLAPKFTPPTTITNPLRPQSTNP